MAIDEPVGALATEFSKPNGIQSLCETRIIDIRRSHQALSLVEDVSKGLSDPSSNGKELPTLLLYNEEGLKLFEDITYLEEYYLTNEEIAVLRSHAKSIAAAVPPGAIICELGSGNLRKVNILLAALEEQAKPVEYYALDVNLDELKRTLAEVPKYQYVQCYGLFGTYDDGLDWLKGPQTCNQYKIVLSLGSSIGNFDRSEAASFLKDFTEAIGNRGAFLLGIDGCLEHEKVYKAYNDKHDLTHRFTLNGLKHANELIGRPEFDMNVWSAIGKYDADNRKHQAYVVPNRDTTVLGIHVRKGEEVRIEESYKYSSNDVQQLLKRANVKQTARWSNERGDYAMHLIAKKQYALPWDPKEYASQPVPTWAEWQDLWQLWDTVSRQMIPDEELLEKPIKLRNACIFYLGHIPTFFDMKLTKTTEDAPTEPKYFYSIFERGIDPDVDNPEQCHTHSEVPDQWPTLPEILAYQRRVRQRVEALYDRDANKDPKVGRCLWLGYEHEAMHLETLLYMLIQSEKTLPPTGAAVPIWNVQAGQAEAAAVPNQWYDIPARDMKINMDDPENDLPPTRYFGWDCEKPSHKTHVHAFKATARPITNAEYAKYLLDSGSSSIPASWAQGSRESNGEIAKDVSTSRAMPNIPQDYLADKYIRTVFGAVPLKDALTWPVSASYDELAGCAAYMGGRIPTLEEARSIYAYAEEVGDQAKQAAEQRLGRTIPAVNSHLVNNGVPESPPTNGTSPSSGDSKPSPHELFADLKGCNVGFQNWHPMPVAQNGDRLSGQADMGGLWEWTSSPLQKQPGYEPMPLYPAYSADFYDGKHNVVLGGSWATVPRIAGRKSFINWYQRNYPYVWAGARLVKDA